jgi:UDP-glucose 4-epimerase
MRLFITGVSGYLGGLVCRALEDDPNIEKITGVDVMPPRVTTGKLEFREYDVRDRRIREAMAGCDAALHMAFILNEIKDKARTYDINVNGSRNVFHACLDAGVPWLIQLSSMAAFGPHPDNPVPLTEEDYPRGAPDCYYCYSKAELEHYLQWLAARHPELEVTVLRPTVIIGENIDNTVSWIFSGRFAARPKGHDSLAQYIHEDDLASAIQLVLREHALGTYHVTSDDSISLSEMMRRCGMFAPAVPKSFLERFADLGFALGASPVSGHWIRMFSESMVGSSEKLKALGWRQTWTSSDLFDEYIVRRRLSRTG